MSRPYLSHQGFYNQSTIICLIGQDHLYLGVCFRDNISSIISCFLLYEHVHNQALINTINGFHCLFVTMYLMCVNKYLLESYAMKSY